ncbi:MAG: hypothetical protein ACK5AQ_07095 [Bacteroidota bacterium]
MNPKVLLIIQREYLTRVRKKSFLIMTLLGPLLMASLILSRYWIEMIPPEPQQIAVVDETGVFFNSIESSEVCLYKLVNTNLESTKKKFFKSD